MTPRLQTSSAGGATVGRPGSAQTSLLALLAAQEEIPQRFVDAQLVLQSRVTTAATRLRQRRLGSGQR